MIELVGDELYQWDVGRKVKITPKRGYTISCVHFNDGSDDSLTMVNGVATARIPDELLQQCGSVTVYAVSTKEGGIETTESRQFYIKKKTKPTGYTHVPTEVATINSAISAATQAKASAEEAKSYRNTAQNYASNASNSATKASTSESNANTYKVAAEKARDEAKSYRDTAKTYASNASNSATKASTSESNANTYKVAAEKARDEAKSYRDTAKTYASNASASATNASTSESNANTYKVAAENAAKNAADSRDAIKSIESNMNTAVEAAGQIDSFREEMTTAHTEVINARNDILSEGTDGESVYEKIINANKATKEAQAAAEQSAKEAKEAATSANQGIVVVDSLEDTSTANALSAKQGKVLNDNKLDKSGGTMTGTLVLSGDPSASNDAATKNYVDTHMPSLVTKSEDGLMSSTDKVKLDTIKEGANKYEHPATHPASMIEEDDTHKFMTDEEKTKLVGIEANANKTTVVDNLESDSSTYALSAKQGKLLKDSITQITTDIGDLGGGDMMKAMYDMDDNGKVDKADDADKFGGQLPSYYAKAKNVSDLTLDIEQINSDLNLKVNNSAVGQANGVASLDKNGKILSTQLPYASANTLGGVKIGANLSIDENGVLSADAQEMTVDNTLDSNSKNPVQNKVVKTALDGKSDTTHNHDGTYLKEVPKATSTTLGGIKVGTGLSVTADGTLSADTQSVDVSTSITENSTSAVSSGAVYSQLSGLKFVVSDKAPTSADDKTFTIVVPN